MDFTDQEMAAHYRAVNRSIDRQLGVKHPAPIKVPIYRQTFDKPLMHIPWACIPSYVFMRDDGVAYIACPECKLTGKFKLPDGKTITCNECKGRGRICANLF